VDGIKVQLEPETPIENAAMGAFFLASRFNISEQEDASRFSVLDIEGKGDKVTDFLKIIEPRLQNLSVLAVGQPAVHGDITNT
jgi:hypothetical protein